MLNYHDTVEPSEYQDSQLSIKEAGLDKSSIDSFVKEGKEMEEERALEKIKEFSAEGALARVDQAIEFINGLRSKLKAGEDYGKHPGYTKPSLEKPGAEKIAMALNCASTIIDMKSTIINEQYGLKEYELVVGLKNRATGDMYGEGVGYGRAHEKDLYAWDKDLQKRVLKPERVEWANNTALKMAFKSGLICAGLTAGALSGYFSQDLDKAPSKADSKEKKETKKESKKDEDWQPAFLKNMVKMKGRLGEGSYYIVLGNHGFEHADQISDRAMGRKVYDKMAELYTEKAKKDQDDIPF